MLDDVIHILTQMMLKESFKEKQNNKSSKLVMSKSELYRFCIKLIKFIKKVEE